MANIAWSFANISSECLLFILRLQKAIFNTNTSSASDAKSAVHSLLWAMWKMKKSDLVSNVFEHWSSHGQIPCVLELGLLVMDSEWQKNGNNEPQLLAVLMKNIPIRLMRLALWKIVKVAESTLPEEAPRAPTSDLFGLTLQEYHRYYKLARFVQYLEMTECGGNPENLIDAVEWFPNHLGRYLKVAGGDKAVVLWDALLRRPRASHEVIVEFGTLVGYTAIRFGAICSRSTAADTCNNVVTVELDLCHACIARHMIDLAGLSSTVEVWVGQARDLFPRLMEEFGSLSLGFIFMDQKGTAFHEDLCVLEDKGMLGVAACIIAGNCLRSGASFFVWHVSGTSKYDTIIWTMPEFVQDDVEDWLVVCEYKGPSSGPPTACPPEVHTCLVQLAWEADTILRSSTSESGSPHVDDFVAFSQYVSHYFKALGIEATPWLGLMQPPGGFPPGLPLSNKQLAKQYEEATLAAQAVY